MERDRLENIFSPYELASLYDGSSAKENFDYLGDVHFLQTLGLSSSAKIQKRRFKGMCENYSGRFNSDLAKSLLDKLEEDDLSGKIPLAKKYSIFAGLYGVTRDEFLAEALISKIRTYEDLKKTLKHYLD